MTDGATGRASGETSDTIPASSAGRRGWQRSIILVAGEETTLALALRDLGYVIVTETATDVIAIEQARGLDEPWRSVEFLDHIVRRQRQRQHAPSTDHIQVQVYDRSPLCTLTLARSLHHPVTPLLAEEVARLIDERVYEPTVFIIRPLGVITPTPARRISYQDSLRFEAIHEAVYHEHSFQLLDVPADTIDHRAAAINTYIRSQHQPGPEPGGARCRAI